MENPTHSFRETKLVLQFIWESQIKIKTGDELELAKKLKENIFFLPFILSKGQNLFCSLCSHHTSCTHKILNHNYKHLLQLNHVD